MKGLLAATLPLLIVLTSPLRAEISTSLVQKPNGLGPNTATFDLVVHVSSGDNWTSTSLKATVTGGTFFNDPLGANSQPDPKFFGPMAPNLPWDTFVTTPESWPNTPTQGVIPGLQSPNTFGSTFIDVSWIETPPNGGGGDWVVARMSVENLTPGWSLAVKGAHTSVLGGSTLFPYSIVVPEPRIGFALAAGLLALACRRGRGGLQT